MNIHEFLDNLYGFTSGWLTIWTRQDKKTYWFDDLNDAAKTALQLSNAKKDVYFGVGLRKEKLKSGRGSNNDVTVIPGFWLDVDVGDGAHKEKDLPPTIETAIELLNSYPLQPSLLIHSGHGLHGYWLFREPWEFDSDDERNEAAKLLEEFQATIRESAKQKGWKLDSTHDLARVLRLPGTMNYKGEPVPVQVIAENDIRYNPSDFEPYLMDMAGKKSQKLVYTESGPVSLIVDNCVFIQYCRDYAAKLSEPEWYAMITNIARAEGGRKLVHELSSPYPKYRVEETEEKIRHALENGHPHTCAYIRDTLGFDGCPEGGCGVNAPIGLAVSRIARAKVAVANLSDRPDEAFNPETIGALAILKKDEPAEYARIKQALKGKVNLNDLERAVNKQVAENQQMRLVQSNDEPFKIEDVLPDIPLKSLRIPYAWSFNENGIWQQKRTKTGDIETICACPVPVILTKRMRNIDTGEEKVELAFYRDKRWHYITADRATVFNRQGLIQLGNKGLPVSSESAKFLVKFLYDLERDNLNSLPLVRSVGHMGWVDGKRFLPGAAGDIELDVDEGTGAAAIAAGYREEGTLDEWVKVVTPLREYPIARFILSASFAAPFLNIVGQRVFIIHVWGPSRGGKTSILKAALSVWGDPEDLMASFNATKVGLERLASFYSDLPLGIDERQVVGDKQGFVESLVYLLGLGKGKARGSKNGGLQQFNYWRTIALTTGEEPLSTGSSTAGIKTRTLELYGIPIPNEQLASNIHDKTRNCFGTAGPAFVRRLLEEMKNNPEAIKDDYEAVKTSLGEANNDNITSHLAAVATVCLADYYVSQWIFGLDEKTAGEQANALAHEIVGALESAADVDDSTRAYEYLISWYNINEAAFSKDAIRERYGKVEFGKLMIYPPVFEKAMKEGGFSPDRILHDWADKGLIETETRKGEEKKRYKVRVWDPEKQTMKYYVVIKIDG